MPGTTLQDNKARKVLVVEDEGDMRLLLDIMLNGKSNLEMEYASSLKDAGNFLQEEQPDVVILDNKLPDGLGIDYISEIKKNYPEIKIIMISGYDASAEDVALENGANVFLQKPFTRDQLYNSIVQLLDHKN
ncbi:MAG: response regulator [Chitinophagaceae bacterium]|jgi:DNA-binding NtrC family response regulator|nr:response regulator [Chitinophagaceae bacterium]